MSLLGNVVRDPELKTTPQGQSVCTLSLATNRVWKDSSGNQQSLAEYHNLVVWGKLAEFCGQNVKKGKPLYVEGYLKTRSFPHAQYPDVKLYRAEVVVENLVLLGTKDAQEVAAEPIEPAPL